MGETTLNQKAEERLKPDNCCPIGFISDKCLHNMSYDRKRDTKYEKCERK